MWSLAFPSRATDLINQLLNYASYQCVVVWGRNDVVSHQCSYHPWSPSGVLEINNITSKDISNISVCIVT